MKNAMDLVVRLNDCNCDTIKEKINKEKNNEEKTEVEIRRVDDLGRVVIPKWMREKVNFEFNDELIIEVTDNDTIVIKKPYEEER